MNKKWGILVGVLVLAGAGLLVWLLSVSPTAPVPAAADSTVAPPPPQATPANRVPRPQPTPPPETMAATPPPESAAPASPARTIAQWEYQIDQILRANASEAQTARVLMNLLPTLPEEGQVEAANHITNLIEDQQFKEVMPLVVNPHLPEDVLDVFMTDLMNRDDSTKLRAFVEIAKVPNHPLREEALSDLEIFLDHDYGNDWAQWNAAIDRYLAQ
jgi:hypothetical protein